MTQENYLLWQVFCQVLWLTGIYDAIGAFRQRISHKACFRYIEELAYWVYATYNLFCTLQLYGDGTVRWYTLFSAWIAYLCYSKLVKKYPIHWIYLFISKLLCPIKKIVVHNKGRILRGKTSCIPQEKTE